MDRILEIKNLTFAYGKSKVLDDISLYIERGDYVGIIGPNGAAKSTLMKIMLGLLEGNSGTVKLLGEDINKFRAYEKIGYISQNVRDFNNMFPGTVEEIVALNESNSIFKKNRSKKVHDVLKLVGIYEFKDRKIGRLSGGQKQRVFIARAILNNPEILFMDEPLVGVDLESQESFYRLMEKLNREYKMTLIMVSHDIERISCEVNKLVCLNQGRVYIHAIDDCNCNEEIKKIYEKGSNILLSKH